MKCQSYFRALSYLDVMHLSHSSDQRDRGQSSLQIAVIPQHTAEEPVPLLIVCSTLRAASWTLSSLSSQGRFLGPNAVMYVKAILFLSCKSLYETPKI